MTQGISTDTPTVSGPCTEVGCAGRWIISSSHAKQNQGVRRLYLKCDVCGHAPAGSPIEVPLQYRPMRRGRSERAVPQQISELSCIRKFHLVKPIQNVVYFLCKSGEVVYVGKAANLLQRLGDHQENGKDFDSVWYLYVPPESLRVVESHWIAKLSPTLNQMGTPKYKALAKQRQIAVGVEAKRRSELRKQRLAEFESNPGRFTSEPSIMELDITDRMRKRLFHAGVLTIDKAMEMVDREEPIKLSPSDSRVLVSAFQSYFRRKFTSVGKTDHASISHSNESC